MWLDGPQDEIALRLDGGESLTDVQAELVDTADFLSEDERAAVWLFSWSYDERTGHDSGRAPAGLAP